MFEFKAPMLAPNTQDYKVCFPKLASVKYDGVRCFIADGMLCTRRYKGFRNEFLREMFDDISKYTVEHQCVLEGEIYCEGMDKDSLWGRVSSTSSIIPKGVKFYCFDHMRLSEWDSTHKYTPFIQRYDMYNDIVLPNFVPVLQKPVNDPKEVQEFYDLSISQGYEGIILKDPYARYFHGRCSVASQIMLKMKGFVTDDVIILDILPAKKMIGNPERVRLKYGLLDTVHKQEYFVDSDIAGSLVVKNDDGAVFKVGFGPGFTETLKREILANKKSYLNTYCEIQYVEYGQKDLPKMGKLIRFRDDK